MNPKAFCVLVTTLILLSCKDTGTAPVQPTTPPEDMWQRVWAVDLWIETILVVGNGDIFVGTYDSALFHSSDNGISFVPSSGGLLPNEDVHALAVSANGYLYAGTYGGAFFLSTDHGLTWSQPSLAYGTYFDFFIGAPGEVFAAVFGRCVRRTTNHGLTWTDYVLPDRTVQAVTRTLNGRLLAGTNSGLYVSTDTGATWSHNTSGIPPWFVHSLKLTSNGNVFAGCGTGVFRSTDSGVSWTRTNLQPDSLDVFRLAVSPNNYIVASSPGQGVFISSDFGATWTNDVSGMTDKGVRCVAVTPEGYVFAGTYNSGIFRTKRPIY